MTSRAESSNPIVFDLDNTLVNTDPIREPRERRNWQECVKRLPECSLYPAIDEMFGSLARRQQRIGIVTSSVSYYARALVDFFDIPGDVLVCWHDTVSHKPDPAPVALALERLGVYASKEIVGVGDSVSDCACYLNAGITAYGAGWSHILSLSASWDRVIESPLELLD